MVFIGRLLYKTFSTLYLKMSISRHLIWGKIKLFLKFDKMEARYEENQFCKDTNLRRHPLNTNTTISFGKDQKDIIHRKRRI